MTSPTDIARRFSRLIFAALESPGTVNKSDLLTAADAFLNAAPAGEPGGLTLARTIAYRAMDFAVFGAPEDHQALIRAARIFAMDCGIKTAFEANAILS